jgi:hypothetical protein
MWKSKYFTNNSFILNCVKHNNCCWQYHITANSQNTPNTTASSVKHPTQGYTHFTLLLTASCQTLIKTFHNLIPRYLHTIDHFLFFFRFTFFLTSHWHSVLPFSGICHLALLNAILSLDRWTQIWKLWKFTKKCHRISQGKWTFIHACEIVTTYIHIYTGIYDLRHLLHVSSQCAIGLFHFTHRNSLCDNYTFKKKKQEKKEEGRTNACS